MERQKLVCLITFDYELFLGRNFGDPAAVLFEPTRKILEVCKQVGVSTTFFADVCSVWAHRNHGLDSYADAFEMQLVEIIRAGHDVGLHIHPHWLFSNFEDGQWKISTKQMYLQELGFGSHETSAETIVSRGVEYLNGLLRTEDPLYECTSFRAAGLALQPSESDMIRVLLESGIHTDSSIAKNLILKMDTVSIDYNRIPKSANWFMAPETGIKAENSSGIFEIPIGTFQATFRDRIGFLLRRLMCAGKLRGLGISRNAKQSRLANLYTLILENVRYLLWNPYYLLSCDTKGLTLEFLLKGFDSYIRLHDDDVMYVSMINHPKLMFDEEVDLLGRFVQETKKRFGAEISFQTFRGASEKLGLSIPDQIENGSAFSPPRPALKRNPSTISSIYSA
jgi:hypothetical protein